MLSRATCFRISKNSKPSKGKVKHHSWKRFLLPASRFGQSRISSLLRHQQRARTWVLLLSKGHNVDALDVVLLRRHININMRSFQRWSCRNLTESSPTQVSNISSARSFLKVGLAAQENTVNHRSKVFVYVTEDSLGAVSLVAVLVYRLCSRMNSTSSSSV